MNVIRRSCPLSYRYSSNCNSTTRCPVQNSEIIKSNFVDTAEELSNARPFAEIPGPGPSSFLWNMVTPGGKYHKMTTSAVHKRLFEEYGALVKIPGILGRSPMVAVYDPKLVEKVFRNEGPWPNRFVFKFFQEFREKERPEVFKGLAGLIHDQGPLWQETRSKVNPVLMQPRNVQMYTETVDQIAQEFIERIRIRRDDRKEVMVDFSIEMNRWSLESITYIALDQRLGLLTEPDDGNRGYRLLKCFDDFFKLTYELEVKPSIWRYYKTSTYHRGMKCLNEMTDLIIWFVEKSRKDLESRNLSGGNKEPSIFEKLLKIDKRVAIITALDLMMGGVDTTSSTVITLLYLLAKHPEKQSKLREEILGILPSKKSSLYPEAMVRMPFLRACIKESQRLIPVTPRNTRKLPQDVVLNGFLVPNKYHIVIANRVLAHSADNFKKPLEFIPERFLKDNLGSDLTAQHPFAFLPFGFGPRMCVGKRIVSLEVEVLIARLIREFQVEWHYPDMEFKETVLNAPSGMLKFRFTEI